jgi:glycosyltransferase involved in cell wall biosynthesis
VSEEDTVARRKCAQDEPQIATVQLLDDDAASTSTQSSVDVLVMFDEYSNREVTSPTRAGHADRLTVEGSIVNRSHRITPENTEFVIVSFEGPDSYSLAGGLGVRVTNLSRALADVGYPVHHIFVGDPTEAGEESSHNGRLVLHRWCQWISRYYPDGLYQGEDEKLYDFNESVPWFVVDQIAKPAMASGKIVVVMGEEWHTTETMSRISDLLYASGLRDRAVLFWNANNTFSFHRINWGRLAYTSTITTVSRYMKQIMWGMGLNPLVIPNGIPASLLDTVDEKAVSRITKSLGADLILSKVARWDPDKRWNMAIEALARLKARGLRTVLLARGGIEPHGEEVMHNARSLGLVVQDMWTSGSTLEDYSRAVEGHNGADLLNIRFHCPQEFLRILYGASDVVLANSGHEPFGLVGLETMAAGGIAITGCTGEDYAVPFFNAIVLETSDPAEIEGYVAFLDEHPQEKERIRRAARQTASLFTWEAVIENLTKKLEYQARIQGLLAVPRKTPVLELRPAEREEAATPSGLRQKLPGLKPLLVGSA